MDVGEWREQGCTAGLIAIDRSPEDIDTAQICRLPFGRIGPVWRFGTGSDIARFELWLQQLSNPIFHFDFWSVESPAIRLSRWGYLVDFRIHSMVAGASHVP